MANDEFVLEHERDPELWVGVPQVWPIPGAEEEFPDVPTWSAAAARAVWDADDRRPAPGQVEELTDISTYVAERFPHNYPGFDVLLHLPDPTSMPLGVYIGDFDAAGLDVEEAEAEVRVIAGAEDPDAVEPPLVEEFTSPHLGSGVRVMRYIQDEEDGRIIVGLRYGWYVPQLARHALVFTLAIDTGRMMAALEDIDALARSMHYVRE